MLFQLDRPAVLEADDQGILQVPGKTPVMTLGSRSSKSTNMCDDTQDLWLDSASFSRLV